MQQHGIVPDVITYNALISAMEKGKQPEQALEMLGAMQQQALVPNIITYNAVICACEEGRQPARAVEAFRAMDTCKS